MAPCSSAFQQSHGAFLSPEALVQVTNDTLLTALYSLLTNTTPPNSPGARWFTPMNTVISSVIQDEQPRRRTTRRYASYLSVHFLDSVSSNAYGSSSSQACHELWCMLIVHSCKSDACVGPVLIFRRSGLYTCGCYVHWSCERETSKTIAVPP